FIYIEILGSQSDAENDSKRESKAESEKKANRIPLSKIDPKVIKLVTNSISDLGDDDGWAFLGDLGNLLLKKKPDFDPRNYGFTELLPFIKSMNKFEIDERQSGKNNIKHIYVRKP